MSSPKSQVEMNQTSFLNHTSSPSNNIPISPSVSSNIVHSMVVCHSYSSGSKTSVNSSAPISATMKTIPSSNLRDPKLFQIQPTSERTDKPAAVPVSISLACIMLHFHNILFCVFF